MKTLLDFIGWDELSCVVPWGVFEIVQWVDSVVGGCKRPGRHDGETIRKGKNVERSQGGHTAVHGKGEMCLFIIMYC